MLSWRFGCWLEFHGAVASKVPLECQHTHCSLTVPNLGSHVPVPRDCCEGSFRMQFPVPVTKDRQLPLSHACICTEEGTNCTTVSLFPLCVPSSVVTSSWCHQVAWWSHYDVIMMSSLRIMLDIDPPWQLVLQVTDAAKQVVCSDNALYYVIG